MKNKCLPAENGGQAFLSLAQGSNIGLFCRSFIRIFTPLDTASGNKMYKQKQTGKQTNITPAIPFLRYERFVPLILYGDTSQLLIGYFLKLF